MDINSLTTLIRAGITSYTAINVWTNTTYGKNHTLVARADVRDRPEEADYPCCYVTKTGRSVGQESRNIYNMFRIDLGVYDTSTSGPANIEKYRKYLESAIAAAIVSYNIVIEEIDISYDEEEFYPFLLSSMQMKFKESIVIGQNPLT